LNALAAYQKALDTAQSFGKEAAELAKTAATVQMAKDAQKAGALSNDDTKTIVKKTLDPDPAKAREEAVKDVEVIDAAKERDTIDDGQAKEMAEDRIRKSQGTSGAKTATPRKGKRKYHVMLIMLDFQEEPLAGTWVLNFGSLREETFESTGNGAVEFDVELDTSRDQALYLRGNPYLTGVSFPPDAEYYYHRRTFSPKVGSNRNLTFEIVQKRHTRTVTQSKTASESEVKLHAVAEEFGSTGEVGYESGMLASLFGKVSLKATIIDKEVTTNSESESSGTSESDSATYKVLVPAKRLVIRQKGVELDDLDLDE
jgi:hypothetical protein